LEYLEERGYTLVERNRRTLHGEIDLVMRDEETLVLIPKYRAQRPLITIPCSPQ
jgi:Holliday junction resolvase-like predicted endonuclease